MQQTFRRAEINDADLLLEAEVLLFNVTVDNLSFVV